MDVYFIDEYNGWLVNNYGKILHTEDGGTTWIPQDSGTGSAITSALFLDEERGWATVNERVVLSTDDGGDNWDALEVNLSLPGGVMFTDVYFVDSMEGWITTTTGASSDSRVTYSPLLHTTDGGDSWSVQALPQDKWLKRIRMVDRDQGWLLGMSGLYYTKDGGNSWVLQLDSGGDPFVDICIPDSQYIWVLSYTGKIYKYIVNTVTKEDIVTESWQIGEHWRYSPQSIWGDTLVAAEYIFGNSLDGQYISTCNLRTRETKRIREIPLDYRFEEPSVYENKVVWSSCYFSEEFRMSMQKDFDTLNWDIFLLDLNTGEVKQITTDEHAQRSVRIYGDTIVWLDNRHEEDDEYPHYYDIYAYDLEKGEEMRITQTNSIKDYDLSISGSLVVWTDSRNDSPESRIDTYPPVSNPDIYMFDLSTNTEKQVTTSSASDSSPVVDNGRIVWQRSSAVRNGDIFLYDVETGKEMQISKSGYTAHDYYPAISGNHVVWADARISQGNTSGDTIEGNKSGAAEIYLYDLERKQEMLLVPSETESEYKDVIFRQVWLFPVIHGDFIVYTLARQVDPAIYAIKLTYQ
jgi:beta propeller repeat protein